MTAKVILNFALQFGAKIKLNTDLILERDGRYFLVNAFLKPFVQKNFYYAGVYLGKVRGGKFFPSFNLLTMLAKNDARRIVVDKKTAWLFICGRDVFRKGVLQVYGSGKKNNNALVLNEYGECLGFGRIIEKLEGKPAENVVVMKNVSDVGDFLRRER